MKITRPDGTKIEFDDTALSPEVKDKPAPEAKGAPTPKAKTETKAESTPTSKDKVPPSAPPLKEQPAMIEEKPSQQAATSSIRSFDLQGGERNISDPNLGKPGFFQFQMPREE